ncbi:type II secretion system GspH family protein [Idiomarina seosinensis]|uniref:type II secretion system protein n=1 Tax=Idiomarina seosinensis TaxID=281739 RepID=UPI00384B42A9
MRTSGFTLIELLITISIMSLAMGLVGPLAIEQLDKFRAQDELVKLEKTIKNYRRLAFINHQTITINLTDSQMTVETNGEPGKQTQFEFLIFQPQQLVINRNGFMQPSRVSAQYSEQVKTLEFVNAGVY